MLRIPESRVDVVVVDTDPTALQPVTARGLVAVNGNGTRADVLGLAGVARVRSCPRGALRTVAAPRRGALCRHGSVAVGQVAAEPDAALDHVTSHFVGAAYDEQGGRRWPRSGWSHGTPTGSPRGCWSGAAGGHGVSAPSTLGAVDAFGLDVLETVCAELGLTRS